MKPRSAPFDDTLDFTATDFRKQPELYRVGKGEQGVLLVEPYKSKLLPHWRFKTVADKSRRGLSRPAADAAAPVTGPVCGKGRP